MTDMRYYVPPSADPDPLEDGDGLAWLLVVTAIIVVGLRLRGWI